MANNNDIELSGSTGTKLGTATSQKLAFWNSTPVVQQADIGALTDSTGGSADGTLVAISGSGDDSNINNNFADLAAKVTAIRSLIQTLGLSA